MLLLQHLFYRWLADARDKHFFDMIFESPWNETGETLFQKWVAESNEGEKSQLVEEVELILDQTLCVPPEPSSSWLCGFEGPAPPIALAKHGLSINNWLREEVP